MNTLNCFERETKGCYSFLLKRREEIMSLKSDLPEEQKNKYVVGYLSVLDPAISSLHYFLNGDSEKKDCLAFFKDLKDKYHKTNLSLKKSRDAPFDCGQSRAAFDLEKWLNNFIQVWQMAGLADGQADKQKENERQKPFNENAPGLAAMREAIKAELKKSWEPELKAERMAAERRQGRENARRSDQSRERGRTIGLCEAASFFIGKGRPDIARHLLSHFMVDRDKAALALEADRRTKSVTLSSLDKSGAWNKPLPTPPI